MNSAVLKLADGANSKQFLIRTNNVTFPAMTLECLTETARMNRSLPIKS